MPTLEHTTASTTVTTARTTAVTSAGTSAGTTPEDRRADLVASVLRGLRELGRGVQELVRRQSGDLGSVGSLAVLSRLAAEGELRCSALAERTGLDVSVASRHLTLLHQHGLITRRPDPTDGRAWLNAVNEAGDTTLRKLRAEWITPARTALSDWDEADLQALGTYLARLEADLHRASDPAGRREARS